MASRKRTTGRRTAAGTTSRRRSQPTTPAQKPIPGQVAIRYSDGQEQKVCQALGTLGTLESQPSSRLVILHRSPGVSHTKVKAALTTLQDDDAIEFATPVMRDAASDTRQVTHRRDRPPAEAGAVRSHPRGGEGRARPHHRQTQRVRTHAVHREGAARERHPHARRRAIARSAQGCRVRQPELSHDRQTVASTGAGSRPSATAISRGA